MVKVTKRGRKCGLVVAGMIKLDEWYEGERLSTRFLCDLGLLEEKDLYDHQLARNKSMMMHTVLPPTRLHGYGNDFLRIWNEYSDNNDDNGLC